MIGPIVFFAAILINLLYYFTVGTFLSTLYNYVAHVVWIGTTCTVVVLFVRQCYYACALQSIVD